MNLVKKKELAKRMALEAGITQAIAFKAINALSKIVNDALCNNEEILVTGFGKWSTGVRKDRTITLPNKRVIDIPAYKYPVFLFGKPIKKNVREKNLL